MLERYRLLTLQIIIHLLLEIVFIIRLKSQDRLDSVIFLFIKLRQFQMYYCKDYMELPYLVLIHTLHILEAVYFNVLHILVCLKQIVIALTFYKLKHKFKIPILRLIHFQLMWQNHFIIIIIFRVKIFNCFRSNQLSIKTNRMDNFSHL